MKNFDISKSPLGISAEALGFFLAGIFSLNISLSNCQITNWVLLIVGAFLSLYGINLLFNLIFPKLAHFTNTFKPYLLIIVLSIGGAQLIIIMTTYGILFQIITAFFFLLFVSAIVYRSMPVFQNRKQLWTMFTTMLVIGCIQLLYTNVPLSWYRWDLYFILLLEVIFIILIIKQTRKLKNKAITPS